MGEGAIRPRGLTELVGPWNKKDAQAATIALLTAITALLFVNTITHPAPSTAGRIMSWALPVYWTIAIPIIARRGHRSPDVLYMILPIMGVSLLTLLRVLDQDATSAAQIVFLLPGLYSGSQLKPLGAALVTLSASISEAVVVFLLLPFPDALRDWIAITTVLCTITVLLVRDGLLQDKLNGILREQAAVDPLTGLVNRRVLEEAVTSALISTAHTEGTALILLDVDNFKEINDGHGHPVGDRALAHIADLIVRHTRPDAVVGRLGGDEMAILLPGCTYEVAHQRASDLVRAIHAEPLHLPDARRDVSLSVSVGVAHAPTHGQSLARVYEAADAGIYVAKRRGRNQVGLPPAVLSNNGSGR